MNRRLKRLCETCGWTGYEEELLYAESPFSKDDTLVGCPRCKAVESIRVVCQHSRCWKEAACGMPTDEGYKQLCEQHYEDEAKR